MPPLVPRLCTTPAIARMLVPILAVGLSKTVVAEALTKVQSAIDEDTKLRQKAQHDLETITLEFEMMNSFLSVANGDRDTNNLVITWVRHVRELAYDLEDCVEFVVHLDSKRIFCRRLLPSCVVGALPLDQAVMQIEDLKGRAKELSECYLRYRHITDPASRLVMLQQQQQQASSWPTGATTSANMLAEARDAARRQQGLGNLTQLITNKDNHIDPQIQVISVWGTGSDLGTTSTIRKAYNDPEIRKKFSCRAWVKLMHPFDPHEFVRRFMAQVYTNSCKEKGADVGVYVLQKMNAGQEQLLTEFLQEVNTQTYLVVLENLADMLDWDAVRTFLPDMEKGSWIIVSTQQFEIASLCIGHPCQPLQLKQFSPDHSVCAFCALTPLGRMQVRGRAASRLHRDRRITGVVVAGGRRMEAAGESRRTAEDREGEGKTGTPWRPIPGYRFGPRRPKENIMSEKGKKKKQEQGSVALTFAMTSCGGGGGGGGCGANCSSSAADDAPEERLARLSIATGAAASCGKCGVGAVVVVAGGVGLCGDCLRAHLFGKFKLAVTSNAMVRPTDSVLLAFSGGPASRVALQFIHDMRSKAVESWDASNSQALPVFDVGVAFVDESALLSKPRREVDLAIADIKSIVSSILPSDKAMHITPLEDVFSSESNGREGRLRELVGMINDDTGREDLLQCLRMLSLQKIALENGYAKIMLGSCASAIACHVLSATVKGQGYSLPADVQYVDTRWEVPVVLPLRDCLAQELSLLCELDSLKTQQLLDRPCSGINGLVASFVARLREENPSREHTVVRTAQKLKPFSFNKFSANGYHDFLPSRLRPKFQNVDSDESTLSEVLCLICRSPFSESELQNLESTKHKAQKKIDLYTAYCCQSCHFQILPGGANMYDQFFSLLPKFWTERVDTASASQSSLRNQIEDYLLEDNDDEN